MSAYPAIFVPHNIRQLDDYTNPMGGVVDGAMYTLVWNATGGALGDGSFLATAIDLSLMVFGPTSATNNAFVRFDETNGRIIKDSQTTEDDSGNVTIASDLIVTGDMSATHVNGLLLSGSAGAGVVFGSGGTVAYTEALGSAAYADTSDFDPAGAADAITNITGNAGTASALQTARAINGVLFDGTAPITVTAAAGTLSGDTLAAGVTLSSLTTLGTIATGVWQGTAIADSYIASAATWNAKASTSGTLAQFAATTSLELKGVISDETGSGALVFATSPTFVTPALGVATATSINGATITTTTGTLTLGSYTLTVANTASLSGTNTGDQSSVSGNAGTATALATARAINGTNFDGTAAINVAGVAPTATTATTTATLTPAVGTIGLHQVYKLTAQGEALTIANPSGTPADFQQIDFFIVDDGSNRAISYGNKYRGTTNVSLPSSTTTGKVLRMLFEYHLTGDKYTCLAADLI